MKDYPSFLMNIYISERDDDYYMIELISTIGYCLHTTNKILIITYELHFIEGRKYSSLHVRKTNGTSEHIDPNACIEEIHKRISKHYNEYYTMITQSHIKSAKK